MRTHPFAAFAALIGMVVFSVGCDDWARVEIDSSEPPTVAAPETPAGNDTEAPSNGNPSAPAPVPPSAPPPALNVALPTNPQIPESTPGTYDQHYYFSYKAHDNTFRIRWPTFFYTAYGVGKGSYTVVNGYQATFRSYDTDGGAMRPSYSLPGPSSRLSGRVTCILVAADGTPLGWFSCSATGINIGRLP